MPNNTSSKKKSSGQVTKISKSARLKLGMRSVLIGILTNMFLAVTKIISGVLGNSYALVTDGIESGLDVFSSIVVLSGIKIASKPPDHSHPFGHGKAEPLAAMAVSMALLGAAAGMAIQCARELQTPHHAPEPFTLITLIVVILIKEGLFRMVNRASEEIESLSLQADAWHHRSDALTSAAAFIGISVSLIAGEGYEGADDIAALFACGIIAINGARILRTSVAEIMDATVPEETESKIRSVARSVQGTIEIEKCRVRKSGFDIFVEIHVEVDGRISVQEGHEIAHRLKFALKEQFINILDVTVHIEPASL
ncbi:MAG: cation-efflux pump [Candidatus Cloacimonetes bacterium 4572_55]|nr:MAG: cation-efflux pump [Candidatus Cloacimonetes bacterium 4572_55]